MRGGDARGGDDDRGRANGEVRELEGGGAGDRAAAKRSGALAGTACAIRAHGREANAESERLFGDTDIVRSLDEEHARALHELVTSWRAARTDSTAPRWCSSNRAYGELGATGRFGGKEGIRIGTSANDGAHEGGGGIFLRRVRRRVGQGRGALWWRSSSGTCVALQLTRFDSPETLVDDVREIVGPRDPEIARTIRPESLRARFGEDKQFNAVHCVDLPEDGPLEVDFFFNLSHRHTIAA